MSKRSDRDRILLLLSDSESRQLPNLRIKTELNLGDEHYRDVRDQLLEGGLVKKYQCFSGGIRLTKKGEKEVPGGEELPGSTVDRESDLYNPLMQFLERQAQDGEIAAVVSNTSAFKKHGKWQNPDVTQIAIEHYHHLRKMHVVVTTFEVKQFPYWDVSVVYEAASHHRFAHESHVVLEWPNGVAFSFTDPTFKLDQIVRECQRFGVGLATLHPYFKSYRLYQQLNPKPRLPKDEDVEGWLEYVFSRDEEACEKYKELIANVQRGLAWSGEGQS